MRLQEGISYNCMMRKSKIYTTWRPHNRKIYFLTADLVVLAVYDSIANQPVEVRMHATLHDSTVVYYYSSTYNPGRRLRGFR